MRAGWLEDVTNWLRETLLAFWNAFVQFIKDAVVLIIESVLDLFATAVEAIPVPDFIANGSIGQFVSGAGETVLWAASTFKLAEGMALLAAGYTFRLLRKLFTLGQW